MSSRADKIACVAVLVMVQVCFGQNDYYVRKATWQETLRLSREAMQKAGAQADASRQQRELWRRVQRDFNDVNSLLEMTMEATEKIWEADWQPGDFKELAKRYVEAARETLRYQARPPKLEQPSTNIDTPEQLRVLREYYYNAFRLMEDAVLREADTNIKDYRMGTLIIKARPGAKVKVEQTRHDFLFGTSLNDTMWAKKEDFESGRKWLNDFDWLNDKARYEVIEKNHERYYQLIKDNFNIGVFQNAAKWFNVEPTEEGDTYWTSAERTCQWALANGLKMRGHCVIWDCERFVPEWQKGMDDANLRRNIERRCKEVATRFAGRINEWDLNNEMVHCRWYREKLGDEIIGDMFRWFKEANPEATLTLNDFNILNNRYRSDLDRYIAQARDFTTKGYALGGINCQGHSWDGVTNIGFIKEALSKLGRLDVPVKISEYIIDDQGGNKEYAAVMLDKHFRVCFANPAVEAIIFWGVWEGTHFSPSDALWNLDFSPRPPAVAYRKLVFDQWWTRWEGAADANGACRVPVFYGKYKINIDGKEAEVNFPKAEGREKTVELH